MRILIVGLGSMGRRRVRNLAHAGVEDVVGFDLAPARRAEAEAVLGIATVTTIEEGFRTHPDAVIVATPPDRHMEYARAAVAAGKHVFAEAGTSLEGLVEVGALAERNKVVAAASCTMRFQLSIKLMKALIDGGRIGRVLAYTHHCGQWLPDWHPQEDYRAFYVSRRETGACREIVAFELTWLNWLIGRAPRRVAAMRGKVSALECDIDDVYQVLLGHDGGALGHIQIDALARTPVRHTRLIGETGTLEWSLTERQFRLYDANTGEWTSYPEPAPRIAIGYSAMSNEVMYEEEMAAFLATVRGEETWTHSFAEDHRILSMLVAAERSDSEGRIIQLPV